MNRRIVFLHYHGIGHINPCLPLAEILEHNGWEVYFAGVEFFSQYVISQGFLFYSLKSVPFGMGFETWVNTTEGKKHVYLSTLLDRITDRLYATREIDLLKMLDDLHPDVILIDATQSTDFIALHEHIVSRRIKVALIHPMLPTYVIPGRPPVNSYVIPGDKKRVLYAITKMKGIRLQKSWKQKIKYLFFDDQFIIRRRIRKNKIPRKYISVTPSLFNFNIQKLAEFILIPREFDFPTFKVESHQHYIGFITQSRQVGSGYESFAAKWSDILTKKASKRLKLIYCSFGSTESNQKALIISFLERLKKAATNLGHLLVISVKDQQVLKTFTTGGDSIFIFPSVPQIEVLRDTDLFISHGGLSSIKESVDGGVPMLLYPIHSDYDPKGNAARVVFHGMGLRGDVKKDSPVQIGRKIKEILSNKVFKDNIFRMKQINEGYARETFLSLIEQLHPLV